MSDIRYHRNEKFRIEINISMKKGPCIANKRRFVHEKKGFLFKNSHKVSGVHVSYILSICCHANENLIHCIYSQKPRIKDQTAQIEFLLINGFDNCAS